MSRVLSGETLSLVLLPVVALQILLPVLLLETALWSRILLSVFPQGMALLSRILPGEALGMALLSAPSPALPPVVVLWILLSVFLQRMALLSRILPGETLSLVLLPVAALWILSPGIALRILLLAFLPGEALGMALLSASSPALLLLAFLRGEALGMALLSAPSPALPPVVVLWMTFLPVVALWILPLALLLLRPLRISTGNLRNPRAAQEILRLWRLVWA